MDKKHIESFSRIPQVPRENWGFLQDLTRPLSYRFRKKESPAGADNSLLNGVELFPEADDIPETALDSLRRLFKANDIPECKGGYPIRLKKDPGLGKEEYHIEAAAGETLVSAGDPDGFRRGIYFLEDRIRETGCADITKGNWQRKPFIYHRISRCFFGPTNRPPFLIDELMDDVDYYPEEYLNKLAHEGVNGLWLTLYFEDLPSTIFPGRGEHFEKRMEKLRKTVDKCAKYGIRIFVYICEPKIFRGTPEHPAEEKAGDHPELLGAAYNYHNQHLRLFCTSSETGRQYLRESITHIFSSVPKLGGVINIMLGEDNGSCSAYETIAYEPIPEKDHCPLCSRREAADLFREQAEIYQSVIHHYNKDAEYIGWFYTPLQHDDSPFMHRLVKIGEKWPENATLMFNFESGGTSMQLGKKRVVLDYSLAYIGPSKLFQQIADSAPRTGAKLQVGCSHEDASVPFIPVPANLYEKYRFLYEHHVSTVLQCWYFGNYPGLMNKAAGELSFQPFPDTAEGFLLDLARPLWHENAEKVARAWMLFSLAYRLFPSNVNFEWYGPLHQSIAWPLHLFPVDEPISYSWILKHYPEVSGDRIGECFGYFHTLAEGLALCNQMSDLWQQGVEIMEGLKESYRDDPDRLQDISLAAAVGLQMKSTCNVLKFYTLREDMIFNKKEHLAEMRAIVEDEIANTGKMELLCRQDCRLGYHPEAEGFLFFPEKLQARILLLEELLKEDFPEFSLESECVRAYTGEKVSGIHAVFPRRGTDTFRRVYQGKNLQWSGEYDDENIYVRICEGRKKTITLGLEPSRLWPFFLVELYEDDTFKAGGPLFSDPPEIEVTYEGMDALIRIPFSIFDGFRHEGYPMRMNIWCPDKSAYWIEPRMLPENRLQFGRVLSDEFAFVYFS